jgi:hypothetical protein
VLHLEIKKHERKNMPTQNPRFNITVDSNTAAVLTALSKHEHKSVASVARELILEALERREDQFLSNLAEKRDTKRSKAIKHDDVWK